MSIITWPEPTEKNRLQSRWPTPHTTHPPTSKCHPESAKMRCNIRVQRYYFCRSRLLVGTTHHTPPPFHWNVWFFGQNACFFIGNVRFFDRKCIGWAPQCAQKCTQEGVCGVWCQVIGANVTGCVHFGHPNVHKSAHKRGGVVCGGHSSICSSVLLLARGHPSCEF